MSKLAAPTAAEDGRSRDRRVPWRSGPQPHLLSWPGSASAKVVREVGLRCTSDVGADLELERHLGPWLGAALQISANRHRHRDVVLGQAASDVLCHVAQNTIASCFPIRAVDGTQIY